MSCLQLYALKTAAVDLKHSLNDLVRICMYMYMYSRRHNKVSVPFLLPFRFLVVLPFLLPFVTVYNRSVFSGVTVFVTV